MDPRFALDQMPLLAAVKAGNIRLSDLRTALEEPEAAFKQAYALAPVMRGSRAFAGESYGSFDEAPEGSVAVIPVFGSLMKEDQDCGGGPGTMSMKRMLQQADQHPNIGSIILHIDSTGGTVAGTESFAQAVKESQTPVITYADDLMASAGYWIGSSAREIIASGKTTEIGSIGTMISYMDVQGVLEEMGVKFHYVTAEASHEKNKAFLELRKGNYEPILKEMLNPLNAVFLEHVKEMRGEQLNAAEALTGKVFVAEQALSFGLIDRIGTFDLAIERATSLSQERRTQVSTHTTVEEMFGQNKFPKTHAVLKAAHAQEAVAEEHLREANAELEDKEVNLVLIGASHFAKGDQAVSALADAHTAIEAAGLEAATPAAAIKALARQVKEAEAAKVAAEAAKAKAVEQAEAADKRYEELAASDGSTATAAPKDKDEIVEAEGSVSLDELPHNKEYDQRYAG